MASADILRAARSTASWRVVKRSNQFGVRALYVTRDGPGSTTWEPRRQTAINVSLSEADVRDAHRFAASEQMLEALKAVVRVADRNTAEFDLARAAIAAAEAEAGR